ncbi:KilA-N domain-containing protein [Arsenophonus nasoniae]|uniref:KilA-N domain protein n=2 Tax=Arsenophonus nasoniae TaxID=638 RepID=A0A4P7KSU8_9GAMM|nr:KilA-N domain-containing protein [Arsenophonus nasoniae]QBY42915.1 KilA-N domain protein [Arsenophonus nasoniae]QBY43195.1 KilA-N domain protein [Arsenophonus nasoniae]QBY44027.1 KilA-N domain protein [Arsenophonus nasoniae]WGM04342.1 KilA-N domain-containing protein [Arsenophonus nasoniae]WGM06973.1 KilA-N domain-containing protein [Arsenophonus nasoniae]
MRNLTNEHYPIIAGVEITTDSDGRFNLNALHKASGGKDAKRPKTWLETKQAKELIEELRQNSALGQEVIKVQKGGINPGTFAHELLAIEYAGWISPRFRLMVNQTFLDYKTGKLAPVTPTTDWLDNPAQLRKVLISYTEQVEKISSERDEAIRTKSQISRTREASAMGKLSVATRKNRELTERLGESVKHATITAVKNATGKEYKFAPLRRWCRENQMEATEVPDIRYGQVKSWPAESWLQVYGINLKSLFANSQRIH